ncbi:MAG: M1 family peptidase [Chitinophagaceae bacterium]|nr:MAG: M1 family peptidase [Chitinophagaceae bacterium]
MKLPHLKQILQTTTILLLLCPFLRGEAQVTRQDTLRGSLNAERSWWDVQSYDLSVKVDITAQTISGTNRITYKTNGTPGKTMQLDLQEPMNIDKITFADNKVLKSLPFTRDGNVYHVDVSSIPAAAKSVSVTIAFSGKPRLAVNPPWDGGWIFKKDEKGRPWVSVACQGLGASVWYPCKDYQGDEPDAGAKITIDIPDTLVAVANGKQVAKPVRANGRVLYSWAVKNPINNYNIIPYIGKYVSFTENFKGAKGNLKCEYWVLDYDLEKAKKQFGRDVKRMLSCFEDWFGPYPFYEDNYKLVESPHLGMEHQSAVAYGNKFRDGYLGRDLSGSGWGKDWDYIIVHESGHEWFGNNITTQDIADMWVHEGFTSYSEVVFTECVHGLKAANEYLQGVRRNISNDRPVIGTYGINQEGSGDMYAKGANLIHIIRQLIKDDGKFKELLRGLNREFYHRTVTSAQVEQYISTKTGIDLTKVFDQYLRATKIPVLEYKIVGMNLTYRWTGTIDGFNMPVKVWIAGGEHWINPTNEWKTETLTQESEDRLLKADPNFYVKTAQVN